MPLTRSYRIYLIVLTLAGSCLLWQLRQAIPAIAWTPGLFTAAAAVLLVTLLLARYAFRLWQDTRRAHLATVRTLVAALDAGDPYTRGQAQRVSRYSSRIARHLGLSGAALEELEFGALLHDLGRTFIQRDILLKQGRLDHEEVRLMQTHPRIGHDILKALPFMDGAAELVLCHHEQPDGRGYPNGLKAEHIPAGARIIMAAAAFDAMTVDRPYRRGLPAQTACDELERCAGSHFFPEVVQAIVDLYQSGRICEDFTPEEMSLYMTGSTVSSNYHDFLAQLRETFDAADTPTIELPDELFLRLEEELAARGEAQSTGPSRKVASA